MGWRPLSPAEEEAELDFEAALDRGEHWAWQALGLYDHDDEHPEMDELDDDDPSVRAFYAWEEA